MEITTDRLDGILMRFKNLGYRITPQRMAIVQVLIADSCHPTVEQVYEKVKKDFPMTSRATVYKTIGLLKDLGEISELNISNGGSHFDGFNADMHPHLVCTRCKEIIDLEDNLAKQIPMDAALRYKYQYQGHNVTIYGICPQCQER